MPWITELDTSRSGVVALAPDSNGRTLRFAVWDTLDDAVAETLVLAVIPPVYRGAAFSELRTTAKGCGFWEVEVNYGVPGLKPEGFLSINFATGEDKVKMTQAFAQTTYPAPGKTAVDYKRAIGIKKDKGTVKAEGIDIPVRAFTFDVERTFSGAGALTGVFVGLLIQSAMSVNSDQIDTNILGIDLHFAPGELLYKGAAGVQKGGGSPIAGTLPTWEGGVKLSFAAQKNLDSVTLSECEHVTKQGWDYAETIYEEAVQQNAFIPSVIQVNVNQVYPRADLGFLFA